MKPTEHSADTPVESPASPQDDSPFLASKMPSHTQMHPVAAAHTLEKKSVLKPQEQYTKIFLLAWAARYVPRGILGEAFEKNAFSFIKKPINRMIDKTVVNHMEAKLNHVLAEETAFVKLAQADSKVMRETVEGNAFYDKVKSPIRRWRGDASHEINHMVSHAVERDGKMVLAESSKNSLRNLVRGKLDDIGYSLSLFVGSSALSLHYSKLVKHDIQNLFRETVAYEKDIPEKNVTFSDIAASDNKIIHATVAKYRTKRAERLGSDSLFLIAAPLKSMHITDFLLGVKGVQMFRDTRKHKETMFEDLITFVNNKINPYNGLGQPISVGEVFDLYQHYAQAYAPNHAFTGVIEHGKDEGLRWAGNQQIFQRMTELMNKTYAYKHQSIVNPATGHTVMQADFALPKFIYLLGHDLIDVNDPKKTLVGIELANSYGIPAVKEMGAMLKKGKSLDDVIRHYHITLPKAAPQPPMPEDVNGVLAKDPNLLDAAPSAPVTTIDANSILHSAQVEEASRGAIL